MNWTVPDFSRSMVSNAKHHNELHTAFSLKTNTWKAIKFSSYQITQIVQQKRIFCPKRHFLFTYHSFNMLPVKTGERAAVPIPPPPETEWYHGRLDRYSAEQRLKTAYKLGSYLGKDL